ncbi:MAG: sensor domain-containing diguanylate cyclase [Candidatus Wallbacteria bacterium]
MLTFLSVKNKMLLKPLYDSKGFNSLFLGIVLIIFIICSFALMLMPAELQSKAWVYTILLIPTLVSAFLFKSGGGTIAAIISSILNLLIFKRYGIMEGQDFMSLVFSTGVAANCFIFIGVGAATDFSEIIFGTVSGVSSTENRKDNEIDKLELAKLRKEISSKQAAIEEANSKVNFISSKMVNLQAIAREIGTCLDFDSLLKSTLNAANKLLKARKISIFLHGEDNKLLLKATYGWTSVTPDEHNIISDHEIAMWSFTHNEMVTPTEIQKDPILSALHRESKLKVIMCAPISSKDEVIGVICVEELEGGPSAKITSDDTRMFSILIDLVSLSFNNTRLFRKVQMLANTDGLTKLFTHRYFQEFLSAEIEKCSQGKGEFSIILSDIDHFKKFNDTYGHQAGDFVLEQTAQCFKQTVRPNDIVARYGGEEFIILLPGANVNSSYVMAERIRKAVESKLYNYNNLQLRVTVSLGISSYPVDAVKNMELVKKSDLALYYSKETGRNKSSVASMIPNLEEWINKKDKK